MIRGDRDQAIAAVEHQIESQPHDPDVLDSAADTFVTLGDTEKAIQTYRRTIEIAPGYAGSRCSLFDLLVAQDQWDEAASLMRDLPRCDQHPTVIARRMQLAARDKDVAQAEQDFEAIVRNEQWSWWAVDQAIDMMTTLGKRDEVLARIERELDNPECNEDFGRAWATMVLSEKGPFKKKIARVGSRIRELITGKHPKAGHAAMSALMPHFSKDGMASLLKQFVKQNEDWIRSDTHCWTLVAFSLADRPAAVSRRMIKQWIEGWRDRQDLQPWMLTNVHELCRVIGDEAAGCEAVQMALQMPADHMQSQLRLWAAHDALVQGEDQLALQHFMGASRLEYLEGLDRVLHLWVEAVINARQSNNKEEAFRQIRQQFRDVGLKPAFFASQPAYVQPYIRTLRMIAQAIGTGRAKFWAWRKILRTRLAAAGLS